MEEPKVKLEKMIKGSLEQLIALDIMMTKTNFIPLALVRLSEKCLSIYMRNEETYLNHEIDYSDSGYKKIKDVEKAIKKLRNLEVTKMSTQNPNKEVGGRIITWHYPAINGDATILLSKFTDDVISLTEVSKAEIKIILEETAIGITDMGIIEKEEES